MTDTKYAWSHDEEYFHGECDTREDAFAEAMEDSPNQEVHIGEIVRHKMSEFFHVDYLLDTVPDNAADVWQDHEWRPKAFPKATKEFDELLNAWATKHDLQPKFFTVKNVEQVK